MIHKKFFALLFLVPFLMSSQSYDTVTQASSDYSTLEAYWAVKPVVKVCASIRISNGRVNNAIRYWQKLGYEFEGIVFEDTSMSCVGFPKFGEIIITIPDQTFDYKKIAITRRGVDAETSMLVYAQIFMQEKDVTKERVLEHELGHALGWNHAGRRYHIMNEAWEFGGSNSAGVSKRKYEEIIRSIELK